MSTDSENWKYQYAVYAEQVKRWNAAHLNPVFDLKYGHVETAPPGYDMVEVDATGTLVFFPIKALIFDPVEPEDVIGVVADVGTHNICEPLCAGSWFELNAFRRPTGVIEFVAAFFQPGREAEAQAHAARELEAIHRPFRVVK